jgi:RNA polymerase sigma-70 factor, ECF subfamily
MGDFHESFEQIYDLYSDDVYRFIFMKVNDQQLAEDLTQDTFVRVFKNYKQFENRSTIKTWLFQISRNITIDYFRSNKKIFSLPEWLSREPENSKTPAEVVELGEDIQILFENILKLKKSHQEILILRKIQEFTIEETAEILKCSISKVKSATHRAMAALRKELEKGGQYDEKVTRSKNG